MAITLRGSQEAVVSNKDLDLPTQQELLAQFRCDEIASASFDLFSESVQKIPVSQGTGQILEGLGGLMRESIQLAMGEILSSAVRSSDTVADTDVR
jgi:hypothetical protein